MSEILKFSIYCVDNIVNAKKYVGCTTRPLKERLHDHILKAKNPRGKQSEGYGLIHEAICTLGSDKFSIRLLEEGEGTNLIMISREGHWIRTIGSMSPHGYNMISRALSDEQIAIIRFGNCGISNLEFARMFNVSAQLILIAKKGCKGYRWKTDPYPYITPDHLPADIEGCIRSYREAASQRDSNA